MRQLPTHRPMIVALKNQIALTYTLFARQPKGKKSVI
jgi:hypothetical protein